MSNFELITIRRLYKIPLDVSLYNPTSKMLQHNPPYGFVVIMEDILHCGIQCRCCLVEVARVLQSVSNAANP